MKYFALGKTIGRGAFGIVKLAFDKISKHKVAIKIMKTSRFKTEKEINRVKIEVKISKQVNHPNIVKTYEFFEESGKIYIVMEYCSKGDLFDYLKVHKKLSEEEAKRIYKQLIDALQYLSMCEIVHRDIKPENVLFDKHMNLKLADFGLAQICPKLK